MKQRFPTALVIAAVLVLTVGGFAAWKIVDAVTPGKYDDFAKCLGEKGLTFYGAYWCPHCQAQKALFGKSVKYLPYVECAVADSSDQAQACKDAGVTGYPTWTGPDGWRMEQQLELTDLAKESGCQLPQ